jgi:cysteinyl-tRNA synthetase
MSMKYLGETFDIHGGGIENVFPHHECEVAQSEAANELPFARYWMHNNMVTVDGQKMGKSLGNFVALKDAFKKYSPLTIRFFILNTHYSSPIDYSDEALKAADKGRERLHNTIRNLREKLESSSGDEGVELWKAKLEKYKHAFEEAMNEDFNTAEAMAVLFNLSKEVNTLLNSEGKITKETLSEIESFYLKYGGDVLGIVPREKDQLIRVASIEALIELPPLKVKAASTVSVKDLPPEVEVQKKLTISTLMDVMIDLREELRASKNWELADKIRNRLSDLGIIVEDKKEKATWRKK